MAHEMTDREGTQDDNASTIDKSVMKLPMLGTLMETKSPMLPLFTTASSASHSANIPHKVRRLVYVSCPAQPSPALLYSAPRYTKDG